MTMKFTSKSIEARKKWHDTFKCQKKRTLNPESYIQQKYPSRMKGKLRHSQMKEN